MMNKRFSTEEKYSSVLAVLRNEKSKMDLSIHLNISLFDLEEWIRLFLEGGKHALSLEMVEELQPAAVLEGNPWQTTDVLDDKSKGYDYNTLIREELNDFTKVERTSNLKLGGIHDFEAWKYYWRYVTKKVREKLGENFWQNLARRANMLNSPRILSLGCGFGGIEIEIARDLKTNYEMLGLDLNEEIMEEAKKLVQQTGLNIKFEQCDLNYISLPKNSFDFVFAHASLHHIINLEHLFQQVHDALSPDGEFFIFDIIGKNRVLLWEENLHFLNRILERIPSHLRDDGMGKVVSKIEIGLHTGMEGIRQEEIPNLLFQYFHPKFYYTHDAFIRFIATHEVIGKHLSSGSQECKDVLDYLIAEDEHSITQGILKPTEAMGIFGRK
jgi:SAM-dependent methyltransferase